MTTSAAGIADVVIVALITGVVTLGTNLLAGTFKQAEIRRTGSDTSQTKFYSDLMARVQQLETQVSTLQTELREKDDEVYQLRLKVQELTIKATLEDGGGP